MVVVTVVMEGRMVFIFHIYLIFKILWVGCHLKASMARKIYLRQGIGVGAFRKIYGGSKSNGVRPSHFAKSSGSIARDCLKQLERLDIIEKDPKG